MRGLAFLAVGYGLLLSWGVVAGILPIAAAPDVVLLCALYLGLSDQGTLVSALGVSVALGYLADVTGGAPHGLYETAAFITCLLGHALSARFLVRGIVVVALTGFLASLVGGTVVLLAQLEALRVHRAGQALWLLLSQALLTALVAPPCFALFRAIDRKREEKRQARREQGAFS